MTNLAGRTLYRLGERLPGQVSMLGEDGCAATHPARVARFANPWRVVAGAVAGLTVCNGPVLFFTSGVFLKPIAADMHWQRSTVSFALSLATFLSALATPILGRMMDRWAFAPSRCQASSSSPPPWACSRSRRARRPASSSSPRSPASPARCRRRCPTPRRFRLGLTIAAASRSGSRWPGWGSARSSCLRSLGR
jgi:MFS family permease